MAIVNMVKAFFLSFSIFFISGCTPITKNTPLDLENLAPNEGTVVGSLSVTGGKDVLGRSSWHLIAKNDDDSNFITTKRYSITAKTDQEEIFTIKMPAGDYTFYELRQAGFSSYRKEINLHFTVQPGKSVYIGRLVVDFPPGYINILTRFQYKVEDAKDDIAEKANELYAIDLSDVRTALATTRKVNDSIKNIEKLRKGMDTNAVSELLGSPVQKHFAQVSEVFGIKLTNGDELWEYHAGSTYIEAIWLVKFENGQVIELGRSQGAILSDIKLGYLP